MCANKEMMLNYDCYITIRETIYLCAQRSSGSYKIFLQIIYIYIYIYTLNIYV